jgi:hypothetical protein
MRVLSEQADCHFEVDKHFDAATMKACDAEVAALHQLLRSPNLHRNSPLWNFLFLQTRVKKGKCKEALFTDLSKIARGNGNYDQYKI